MAGKPGMKPKGTTEVADAYSPDFLEELDQRFKVARTLRQRLTALTNDLGDARQLSYQETSLCRRVVHLERLIEKRESTLAHGGTIDESVYLNAINVLIGLFGKIGLKRRPKVVTSLGQAIIAAPEVGDE